MRSFYAKLTALFIVLMLVLSVVLVTLAVQSALGLASEAEQKLNRTLAADLVPRFEPILRDSVDHEAVRATIEDLTGINRRIEIYLLDGDGMIKERLGRDDDALVLDRVALDPLHRFAEGAPLPILGDDPLTGQRKPFSVAPTEAMGEADCYLYIVLDSERYASAAGMIRDSYILRGTLKGFGLVMLAAALVGALLFGLLTRRLRRMREVVGAFERGDFDRRVDVRSGDEVGQLAQSFNHMADTIVAGIDELKAADAMRRELVANVSHDLRSPIAAVQGYLETTLMKGEELGPEERRQYLGIALRKARRMGEMVGDLFELSKLDARQVRAHPEPFSVAELVQDVTMQYEPLAAEAGVDLAADFPSQPAVACADIAHVERVVANLIDNAVRYTQRGGHVRVGVDPGPEAVRVAVCDDGPGIPPEDLPHVFERFYRVEKSRSEEAGGTGLGLAIASKLLRINRSALQVESTVGKGTTFHFDLPVPGTLRAEGRPARRVDQGVASA